MRRHEWALAVGAGVGAALLVLLGTLQVRWLDQVAHTIAAQKRAALFRQGTAIATELERELTRVFLWFDLEDAGEGRPLEETLRERWRSWREAGRHPALLKAVWLAEPGSGAEEPRLRRLGPTGTLEAAAWPPALVELRGLLRDDLMVMGLLPVTGAAEAWLAIPPGGSRATVLLEVDERYLARDLLPALARDHRGLGDEGGPILARLEDAEGGPRFASTAGSNPFRAGEHDPIVILGVRPDLATPALLAGMRPPRRWPPEMHVRREGPGERRSGQQRAMTRGSGVVMSFGAGLALPPPQRVFTRMRVDLPPPPGHLRDHPPGHPGRPPRLAGWRLSLAFAAGPVDDVVTSLRRRNMTLGFSILALLGGAIAALTIAVRRAHALAERQRQFMASVSHELRTPLAVIGSAAENLRDGTVEDAVRVREYGTMIHAESKRLNAMVDHALRLAAGQDLTDELQLRPVDLRSVVDTAVDSFSQELQARGGLIERSYPLDAVMVAADPEALRQAVENVVGNALKYGGEPPWVSVRVAVIQGPRGTQVQIAVEDRGLGIPPEELGHVFEPFFRGRQALIRQIRGTGLGLALVARLMHAHGGTASVASTPGRGSVFVLRLPAQVPVPGSRG